MTMRRCFAVFAVFVLFSLAAPSFAAQTQTKLDGSGNLEFDVAVPSSGSMATYKMNMDGTFTVPGTSDSVACDAAHRGALRWNLDKQIFEGCYYVCTSATTCTGAWRSLTRTDSVLSQSGVAQAINCSGNNVGGYCDTHYYIDIVFPKAFSVTPNVIVSPNLISDQGGSIGNATDQSYSKATNITKTGFRMWCSGSPMPGDPYNGWSTIGSCNWLAVMPE